MMELQLQPAALDTAKVDVVDTRTTTVVVPAPPLANVAQTAPLQLQNIITVKTMKGLCKTST